MLGWLRLLIFGFIALTLVYWALGWYLRSVRRERLENEFDAGGIDGDRAAYIQEGVADYATKLRPRLLIGVYVIPCIAVITLTYLMNFA